MMRRVIALSVAVLCAGSAYAGPVYDNGPINGTIDAWTINSGYSVSNSFTVAQGTSLSSATLGLWASPGDALSSLSWTISTGPGGAGTVISSGTSNVKSKLDGTNAKGYNLLDSSFKLSGNLSAGTTYWLTVSNANVTNNDPIYWDQNNGPSTGWDSQYGILNGNSQVTAAGFPPGGSESFHLDGSATAPTPAPTTLAILGGMLAVGVCYVRRNRSLLAA